MYALKSITSHSIYFTYVLRNMNDLVLTAWQKNRYLTKMLTKPLVKKLDF